MKHLDGFGLPVPRDRPEECRVRAAEVLPAGGGHGVLSAVEAVEDVVPEGVLTPLALAAGHQPGEVAVSAFIACRDRARRDAVNAGGIAEPRMPVDARAVPFDGRRLVRGGFRPIVAF
ncbi:MAG: DUF1428 family protein [Rhodobacteraceae bacterium]|jgi:uncharacterized protein YbaA (DUF1428 family)|nr:DUF1428 family protein [Paracoccaceae bacterium]